MTPNRGVTDSSQLIYSNPEESVKSNQISTRLEKNFEQRPIVNRSGSISYPHKVASGICFNDEDILI